MSTGIYQRSFSKKLFKEAFQRNFSKKLSKETLKRLGG